MSNNWQHIKGSSMKQEKMDNTVFQKTNGSDADRSRNRLNLDLNIATDTCDDSLSDSVMKQGGDDGIELGGIHKRKIESHHPQMLPREFSGSALMLEKPMLQKSDYNLRLPRFSFLTDNNDSDVSLDLQLKLPCRPEPRLNWLHTSPGEMADLSLSLGCSFRTVACTAIQPEPNEAGIQKERRKVRIGSIHVKSEPCEGNLQDEASKSAGSSNPRSACSGSVKSEPLEEEIPHLELDDRNYTKHNAEALYDTSNSKVIDFNSECMVDLNSECVASGVGTLRDDFQMPNNASMLLDASKTTGEALNLASQAHIPDSNKSHHHGEVPICSSCPKDANGIVSESLENVESLTSGGKELNLAMEFGGMDGKASDLILEAVVSDENELIAADGVSDGIIQTGVPDGNIGVAESGEKIEASAEIPDEESFDSECETDSSHQVVDRGTVIDQRGNDNKYKDGEARGLAALNNAGEGSIEQCEGRQEHGKETTDLISPVDVPITMPLHEEDVKEKHIQIPDELKNVSGAVGYDGDPCNDQIELAVTASENLHESSALGTTTAVLSKEPPVNAARKTKQCHLGKEKVSETKSILSKDSTRTTEKGSLSGVGSQEVKARGPHCVPSKHTFSSKTDSAADGSGKHSKTIKLNSGPIRSSYKKTKLNSSRPMGSHNERDRYNDRTLQRDRPHSRWHRDANQNERYRRPENERRDRTQQFGKQRSDWKQIRRPENAPEGVVLPSHNTPVRSSGRQVRRLTRGGLLHLSHLSSRRQTLEDRVKIPADGQTVDRPIRHIIPKVGMRDFPDGMVDRLPFSHPLPQYGRLENSFIRRERNLSPTQRGSPIHLPPSFMPSPRSLEHPTHQWSPPRKTPDVFNGDLEEIHCGSSQVIRHDRMQSPRQRTYHPQDMMGLQCGSPPCMPGVPEVMRDMGPSMEHQFLRPSGGYERNIPRFDMDPRETAEEESFEPLHYNQFGEPAADPEIVEDRRCEGRLGIFRPFIQHYNDQEGPPFSAEDSPRSFGFHPEIAEVFPNRGNPRNIRRGNPRNIRNRLGDTSSGGPRDMEEEEENYMYNGKKGWHGADFNNARMKRRRC